MIHTEPGTSQENLEEFLERYTIKPNRFTTGVYDKGITIYRQQIRSLNLFYALKKLGYLRPDYSVCIVGAGVSGLTLAACFLKSGMHVSILEKECIFLPLQHGCDVRTVHPHLYDWPDKGALYPYAKLPILSWKAGTASSVTNQILQNYLSLKEATRSSNIHYTEAESKHLEFIDENGVISLLVKAKIHDGTSSYSAKLESSEHIVSANYIIYCTGYGIEEGALSDVPTPSYWRNDLFGQITVNDKRDYFVSGDGDGALIDLFRLKIVNFSYDAFLNKLYSLKSADKLIASFRKIKEEYKKDLSTTFSLFNKFEKQIPEFEMLEKMFQQFIFRNDVKVTLVCRSRLESVYNLDKISFINALILYLCQNSKLFDFVKGETEIKDKEFYIKKLVRGKTVGIVKQKEGECIIVRHGTMRESPFNNTTIDEDELKVLKVKQEKYKAIPSLPLWTFPDIIKSINVQNYPLGYFSSETIAYFSNFTSILNSVIKDHAKKLVFSSPKRRPVNFRVTTLRQVNINGDFAYQQISPYYGTKKSKGNVGKVFPLSYGNVGLSISTGETVFIKSKSDINQVKKYLNLEGTKGLDEAKAFLSFPICARVTNGKAVNLVIYLDTDDEEFLDDGSVFESIVACCSGLQDSIQKSLNIDLYMDELVHSPPPVSSNLTKNFIKIKQCMSYIDLKTQYPTHYENFGKVLFADYYTFDIYHSEKRKTGTESFF